MIIKAIRLYNAGPFLGDWAVTFPEGPSVVLGEYEESEVRSNRSGKSWLSVDAPRYAMFGDFRGKSVDAFPHRLARGKEEAFVEMEVQSSDGRDWEIRRGRTAGGDPIRLLDGSPVSDADLLRVVEGEILGLSMQEYLLTNMFVQGRMHQFMEMTAAEKRRVVSPWFKTDRWVPRADLAKARLHAERLRLRLLEAEEGRLSALIEEADALQDVLTEAEADAEEIRGSVEAQRKLLADGEARNAVQRERVEAARDRRRELDRLTDAVKEERAAAEGALQNAEMSMIRSKEAVQEARGRRQRLEDLSQNRERLEAARDALAGVKAEVKVAARERAEASKTRQKLLSAYKSLQEERTGICPVLRESCDRIERDEESLLQIKKEGLSAARKITALGERIERLEWKVGMSVSDLRGEEDNVAELERLRDLPTAAEAERNYEAARRRYDEAVSALSKSKTGKTPAGRALRAFKKGTEGEESGVAMIEDLSAVEDRIRELKRELRAREQAVAEALAAVTEVDRAGARLEEISAEREEIRRNVSRLAWASYAFGAAGIPSREMENAFGVAEDAMNRVLEQLDTQLRVRFSPTRELKDWETGCLACGEAFEKGERTHRCRACGTPRRKRRKDELRLEVDDGENMSSFELDSGGGKVLLSVGVRLGLASLPGAFRRVRCEHLIIDEPDGALDAVNQAALHALIRRISALGIRQTILITHADVRREFSSAVTVHRWDGEDRSAAWNG